MVLTFLILKPPNGSLLSRGKAVGLYSPQGSWLHAEVPVWYQFLTCLV